MMLSRRRLARPVALLLLLAGGALLALLAWTALDTRRSPSVTGLVTNVAARDIGHAASIMLRTTDGQQLQFQVAAEVDPHWTPGHLRDHMTFGTPITVHYRRDGDALVAVRITD